MNDTDRRLWPFKPRASLISAAILLAVFLLLVAVLRATLGWPSAESQNVVFIGVLVLSLLPILLPLLDVITERGAIIEYAGVKVDFSQSREMGTAGITVPPNIGVRGQPVTDTSTVQILGALKQATASDVVIIDLEEGQACGKRAYWSCLRVQSDLKSLVRWCLSARMQERNSDFKAGHMPVIFCRASRRLTHNTKEAFKLLEQQPGNGNLWSL